MVIAVVFVAASIAIVLAPKAARTVDPASVGLESVDNPVANPDGVAIGFLVSAFPAQSAGAPTRSDCTFKSCCRKPISSSLLSRNHSVI